jgi:2-polyprenyl-3-methyl-5-hydroxy-6-metoxy-1,4-benzoquinol methylase/uncharacterized protein YbaR (Trm112 family)
MNWLEALHCAECFSDLQLLGDRLACANGHDYPITDGVPRLLPEQLGATGTVHESFTAEWDAFDYDDRTWGSTVEERQQEFLRHVDLTPEQLEGKRVLDAGCGNGALSRAIAQFGCDVVACDISDQPLRAHRHFGDEVSYLQADLTRPPFKPGTFDVIFCAGVLHHTPDTRQTFEQVMPLLAPGGTIFVWLYHHVPGRVLAIKSALRRGLSRLPAPVKASVVRTVILPQAMARQHLRARRGQLWQGERDRMTWRERYVVLLDSYTPRYRWEHTQDELAGWYAEHGLTDIHTTENGDWGFGVVARRQPVHSLNS